MVLFIRLEPMRKRSTIAVMLCVCGLAAWSAWLPDVTEQAAAELGGATGTPQINGFVFVAGRYIPPPYTVTRKGNGIFINRVQVDQPVPWQHGAAPEGGAPKAVDADGDFEVVPPAAAARDVAPAGAAADIDDLFGDLGAPVVKPEAAPSAKPEERGPAQAKRDKAVVIEGLEKLRNGYETALGRGEVFFFGPHKRVNGNYGTARAMMGVLPQALRQSHSPQDLLRRLRRGGVFFIDIAICGELYRNRTTFPLLESRLKKIEEAEALEEARRRREARRW